MPNLSDKELDRLSREAAENYENESPPGTWNKLEQLLDHELGRSSPVPRSRGLRLPVVWSAASLLLIGTFYLLFKHTAHTPSTTQKQNNPIALQPASGHNDQPLQKATTVAGEKSLSSIPAAGKEDPAKPSQGNLSTASQEKNKVAASAKDAQNTGLAENGSSKANRLNSRRAARWTDSQSLQTTKEEVSNSGVTANSGRLKIDKRLNGHANEDVANLHNINNSSNSLAYAAEAENHDNSGEQKSNSNPVSTVQSDERYSNTSFSIGHASSFPRYAFNGAASLKSDAGNLLLPRQGHSRGMSVNRSLQFGLLISPDVSSAQNSYSDKIGTNVGFTIGVSLSSKWSLNTGLLITNKHYTSNGQEFHAPPGYWTNMVRLDFVKGNLHMLEVPLNLRYDFKENGKTRFFVSSGVSSYFMQKENNQFYYHDGYAPYGRIQRSSYKSASDYWLSALNISAGFETRISSSFSLQAEPFVKLPLKGIGLGKVNLNSYGMNFSLRFSPALSAKRNH